MGVKWRRNEVFEVCVGEPDEPVGEKERVKKEWHQGRKG